MKKLQLGLSCSPAHIVSHKIMDAKILIVDHRNTHVVYWVVEDTIVFNKTKDKYVREIHTLDGRDIDITEKYIISEEEHKIVKLVTDITAHMNYDTPRVKSSIQTAYFRLAPNQDYEIVNDYRSTVDSDMSKAKIQSETDTEWLEGEEPKR